MQKCYVISYYRKLLSVLFIKMSFKFCRDLFFFKKYLIAVLINLGYSSEFFSLFHLPNSIQTHQLFSRIFNPSE